jgi:hypothetical protein
MSQFKVINTGGHAMWINMKEWERYKRFFERVEKQRDRELLLDPQEMERENAIRYKRIMQQRDNRKLALIMIGHTRFMAWVDTITNKAYKSGVWYEKTWMEIPRFKFERWATSFDV